MPFSDYLKLFASLVAIVALITVIYLGTKWMSDRVSGTISGRAIRLYDRLYVGQNKSLVVVGVGKKFFLLSVADKQVGMLCELDAAEMEGLFPQSVKSSQFSDILKGIISGKNNDENQ